MGSWREEREKERRERGAGKREDGDRRRGMGMEGGGEVGEEDKLITRDIYGNSMTHG